MAQCRACYDWPGGRECDGALPSCRSCWSAGNRCSYAVRTAWMTEATEDLDMAVESPSWDSASQLATIHRPFTFLPDATPFETAALYHFIRGVSPTLVALETADNPNFSYIPLALAGSSKALFHALVACGASHASNWGRVIDKKDIRRSERKAMGFLEKDMVELAGHMARGDIGDAELRDTVNTVLAVLQMLVQYLSTLGDTKLWRRHLQGASSLIVQVTKYREGKQPIVLDTFLLETLRYLDIQAALSLNCGTSITSEVAESGWAPNQLCVLPSVTGMHGFSRGYIAAVARIVDLSHQLTTASPPPLQILHHTATSIFLELESCRAQVTALENDAPFRKALLDRLALGSHTERLDGHFRFADSIYYAAQVLLAPFQAYHTTLVDLIHLHQTTTPQPSARPLPLVFPVTSLPDFFARYAPYNIHEPPLAPILTDAVASSSSPCLTRQGGIVTSPMAQQTQTQTQTPNAQSSSIAEVASVAEYLTHLREIMAAVDERGDDDDSEMMVHERGRGGASSVAGAGAGPGSIGSGPPLSTFSPSSSQLHHTNTRSHTLASVIPDTYSPRNSALFPGLAPDPFLPFPTDSPMPTPTASSHVATPPTYSFASATCDHGVGPSPGQIVLTSNGAVEAEAGTGTGTGAEFRDPAQLFSWLFTEPLPVSEDMWETPALEQFLEGGCEWPLSMFGDMGTNANPEAEA